MYSYIKGILVDAEENLVILEAGGIGYNIYTTASTFDYLPAIGEEIKLYTYLNVSYISIKLKKNKLKK